MESGQEGDLLVATLCLLEVSNTGLTEAELRELLADEANIKPPSPFEEKGWFNNICFVTFLYLLNFMPICFFNPRWDPTIKFWSGRNGAMLY